METGFRMFWKNIGSWGLNPRPEMRPQGPDQLMQGLRVQPSEGMAQVGGLGDAGALWSAIDATESEQQDREW